MTTTNKNIWKHLPLMVMVLLLALAVAPAINHAQDADDPNPGEMADVVDYGEEDDADDEGPAFQNPAQAQKAENLANRAARDSDDEELAERVDNAENAEQELAAARERLANLPEDATEEERRQAVQDVRQARRDVRQSRAAVAERLSEISGELEADITRMREEGYGWGQIAHELGVHPSALGLGHKYGHRNKAGQHARSRHGFGKQGDISAATTRDTKSGWGARGHGISAGGKGRGKGRQGADAFDSAAGGQDKGKSSGRGGGKSGGKGGGKGGGNGGGKGGGNGKN